MQKFTDFTAKKKIWKNERILLLANVFAAGEFSLESQCTVALNGLRKVGAKWSISLRGETLANGSHKLCSFSQIT